MESNNAIEAFWFLKRNINLYTLILMSIFTTVIYQFCFFVLLVLAIESDSNETGVGMLNEKVELSP